MTGWMAGVALFSLFILTVMIHEVSHGWVALRLGDPTAKLAGRLTFNPLRHIDPVGTVLLPLLLVILHAPFVFGWARPVPINPRYFQHPKWDMLRVGAAGPVANFGVSILLAAILKAVAATIPQWAEALLKFAILINLVLGTFNLLPIPPLDGSRVLAGLLPPAWARAVLSGERWGILLVVVLLSLGLLDRILWPVVAFFGRVLGL